MGFRILPKNYLLDWGEFESFSAGVSSAPDGWIIATSPTIAREASSVKYGSYSVMVVGSSGGLGGIYRTIPNGSDYKGKTFVLGVWGKSASTGPYVEINDGVASVTYHLDGSNAFVFATTPSIKLDYNATQIRVNLMSSQNATAYFDGAVLCEGEDLYTQLSQDNILVENWGPNINMKLDQYEIAGREGSFIPDVHAMAQQIRIRGTVVGSDIKDCRKNLESLHKSLLSWNRSEKRSVYLYDERVRDCYLEGFDWDYLNSLQFIRFTVQLKDPDASSRYINMFRNRTVISGTITEFNLTYNGNFESKPNISFIANQGATISTCLLENLTTGESLSYVGTVPTGVALDIDCFNGTVLNSSGDSISNFSGDFLKLVRGTNNLRFSGSNCQINIDYFERYL